MSTKDDALLRFIVTNTEAGKIRWEPAAGNAFMAPLRGDHTVTIEYHSSGPNILTLRNRDGVVILNLNGQEYRQIEDLFESARRNAYEVDKVIDEILSEGPVATTPRTKEATGPITEEDIPF
jgi:hypothetical protein